LTAGGLVSLAEFGRRHGVTREAVRAAVKRGRIQLSKGGKIDPRTADKAWRAGHDPAGHGGKRGTGPSRRGGARSRGGRKVGESGAETPDKAPESGLTFLAMRTRREAAAAAMAELQLRERQSELVAAKQVRERVFRAARAARDLVLGITDRLAPRLVGQDEATIRRLLGEETARVCTVISHAPDL
jgi:hypothetical protein